MTKAPPGRGGGFRVQAVSVGGGVTTAWSEQGWGETAARGRRGGDTRGERRRSGAWWLERSCLCRGLWGVPCDRWNSAIRGRFFLGCRLASADYGHRSPVVRPAVP